METVLVKQNKSTLVWDVMKMVTGTTSAQVVSSLAAPVIARLFAPEAFGVAALFASITGIIGVISCLQYECSILLPERDEDAANATALSLCLVFLTSALTIPLVWFGRAHLVRWLKAPQLGQYLWLIPVAALLGGLYLVLTNWSTRKKQFGRITISQFLSTFGSISVQVGIGLAGFVSGGTLILGSLSGLVLASLFLGFFAWRDAASLFIANLRWSRIAYSFRRYSTFAKFGAAAAVLNSISWQLPAFLLSAYFSTAVVGQYSLGNRLLRIPMNLIGLNIARVFLQRAAEARLQGTLRESVENAFRYLAALSVFPSLILSLVGKDVFAVIFGQRWAEAGVYTQILALWVCFWFISSPLSVTLVALEEQALELRMQYLIFGSRLVSLLAGGMLGSPIIALGLFAGTGVFVYGYYCTAILRKCGVSVTRMAGVFAMNLLLFVPAALILLVLKFFAMPSLVVLGAAAVLILLYYLNLVRTDPMARNIVNMLVNRVMPQSTADSHV